MVCKQGKGLVSQRRAGEEIVFTVAGRRLALLRVTEVARSRATFTLELPWMNVRLEIGLELSGGSVKLRILAPRWLGVFRGELLEAGSSSGEPGSGSRLQ